jgi:phosphatidylserine/phosphatidylglycerophosphate/cardiolipin synthase-like enzyme
MSRTVRADMYADGSTPPPGGEPHAIAEGDGSMLDQYVAAIDAAREYIYFENQAIGSPVIVAHIEEALKRGVDVTYLVPKNPPMEMLAARKDPANAPFFEHLARLGTYENFLLAGIAGNLRPGEYHAVYVHAKTTLIDDAWATIGSTNIANRSFHRDTELNASIWHPETVRALRVELLQEHLSTDTSGMGGREAMAAYREVAAENTALRQEGAEMTALAHTIDPAKYGL